MNIAVTEHSNPEIKTAFQVQGGFALDLTKSDTIIDFIYTAPPEVEINGLDVEPDCIQDFIVLDKGENVTVDIKVKETYVAVEGDDGICYLDTANLQIINGFAEF